MKLQDLQEARYHATDPVIQWIKKSIDEEIVPGDLEIDDPDETLEAITKVFGLYDKKYHDANSLQYTWNAIAKIPYEGDLKVRPNTMYSIDLTLDVVDRLLEIY